MTSGALGRPIPRVDLVETMTRFARKRSSKRRVRYKVRIASLLWLFATGPELATPADATSIRAKYSLAYAGLPIGSVSTVNTIGGTFYEVGLDASMATIGGVGPGFRTVMKSSGTLKRHLVQPSTFSAKETGLGDGQTTRLTMAGGTVKSAEIDPPMTDLDQRVPLRDEHRRNVVDPASSLIMAMTPGDGPLGPAACNRVIRLFDGTTRTDIELEFVKVELVNSTGYRGEVFVCAVRYHPIAGHKTSGSMTKFMQANTAMEVRLAAIPDTQHLVVVSAKIPLQLGTVSLEMEGLAVEPAVLNAQR